MNLHHLKLFLDVAEEGSVTRGAERAAVSQPAVSRAISDLESALGVYLFDRGPKGVSLTESGLVLLSYAKRIFTLELEATEALADLKALGGGTLSIGASTTVGDHLLPPAIARFVGAYPSVRFSMEVANTEIIQQAVLDGRYEAGFTEGSVEPTRFDVEVVSADELVVFCSPGHPIASARHTALEEIAPYSFVLREAGSGTRLLVESRFREVGFEPKIACELGSTNAIKRAVSAGIGLGFASDLTLDIEIARGELIMVPTPLSVKRQLHLVRLPWRRKSAALREFLKIFRETTKSEEVNIR